MTGDELALLRWIDSGGIGRGMHVDDGTGRPLCGRYPKSGIAPGGRQGHYEEHVLRGGPNVGRRETLGEWRERMGHTFAICERCLHKLDQ